MTAAELARRHGVTAQTVRDWVRSGLPGRRRGKVFTFEQKIADAWVRANYDADRRNGGKREGAGRKPKARTATKTTKTSKTPAALPEPIPTTPAELERLAAAGQLTTAGLNRAAEAIRLRRLMRDEDLEAGRLIDAKDAEHAWTQGLQAMRAQLEQMAARTAAKLGEVMTLPAALVPQVRGLLTEEVDAALLACAAALTRLADEHDNSDRTGLTDSTDRPPPAGEPGGPGAGPA